MADVAAEAGVSHQTVSRVLNGHAYVRDDTRERVLAAIRALGYRPNQAARTLATSRSATIGIVTTGTTHYGPASTVLAIEEAARAAGYFVSIAALNSRDSGAAAAVLDQLITQGVDGIVVVAPLVDVARLVDDVAPRIPVVVVAARRDTPEGSSVRYVAVDQRAGAVRLTARLIELGHERIAHIEGPSGWFDAIERSRGFADALEVAGARGVVIPAEGWSAQHGYDVGARLADEVAGGVTAVFAGNDYLALGAMRALWERGVEVPDGVSVAGFDDIDGSGFLVPSLTTVRQPFSRLGAAAVAGLIDAWGGADAPDAAAIAPELVERDSTAPPTR